MKTIKKVSTTPMAEDTGIIIDSFSTTDDKHTNAPSINAVEGYVSDAISNIKELEINVTNKDGSTQTVNYDGSADKTLNLDMSTGIYTITGSMSVPENDSALKLIDFPTGYTKDNCVALTVGCKGESDSGYSYGTPMKSDGNPYSFYVRLGENENVNKIGIHYYNSDAEIAFTLNYIIVLMKV